MKYFFLMDVIHLYISHFAVFNTFFSILIIHSFKKNELNH